MKNLQKQLEKKLLTNEVLSDILNKLSPRVKRTEKLEKLKETAKIAPCKLNNVKQSKTIMNLIFLWSASSKAINGGSRKPTKNKTTRTRQIL